MAWGISPRETKVVPLAGYSTDHYLTLLYHAMEPLGWHISYFDHDGIIAYTNISWPSYSEEVSARVINSKVFVKSECVGYQGLFTDYGKNKENLDLLFGEIHVREVVLNETLPETAQQLMDSIPVNQFVQLNDPPLAGKEKLQDFWAWFTPQRKYFVTPLLIILNIAVFIVTKIAFSIIVVWLLKRHFTLNSHDNPVEQAYLILGFNNRPAVLHGQVWRLFTSTFLHFNLLHIVANLIVLMYIGAMIESKLGKWNFLFLYICTGVIASMSSVIWSQATVSAGASGAIFGLFGILLALLSTNFYEQHARKAILISTAIFVAYNILPVGSSVDHAAHFGGLISGYILGWVAYLSIRKEGNHLNIWLTGSVSLILTVAFVIIGLSFTVDYKIDDYRRMAESSQQLSGNIGRDFYNYEDTIRSQKLATITQFGLVKLKHYNQLADSISVLPLPPKLKKEAIYRSKIIKLQCKYFNFLYLELRDSTKKYRPAIVAATDSINKLRMEMGNGK